MSTCPPTAAAAASIMPRSMPRPATSTWRTPPTTPSTCSIRRRPSISTRCPVSPAVAGALVSDESHLVFTSNRGENTIGVFAPGPDPKVTKIAVGVRPNGLAYDARPPAGAGGQCRRSRPCRTPTRFPWSISMRRDARLDRGAGPHPLGGVRCRGEAFYVNIMHPRRSSWSTPASPTASRARCRSRRRRARPRLRSGDAPAVLRLRCRRAGHARCRHGQGAERGQAQRRARRRLVQPQAPAALCRGRRSRRGRCIRHHLDEELGGVATEKGAHTTAFPPAGDRPDRLPARQPSRRASTVECVSGLLAPLARRRRPADGLSPPMSTRSKPASAPPPPARRSPRRPRPSMCRAARITPRRRRCWRAIRR